MLASILPLERQTATCATRMIKLILHVCATRQFACNLLLRPASEFYLCSGNAGLNLAPADRQLFPILKRPFQLRNIISTTEI